MRGGTLLWATALLAALSPLCGRAEAADRHAGRRMMASRYEMHGLVEKAVAEYLKILASDPGDPQAKARAMALISVQMPTWLPQEAEGVFPFAHEVVVWEGEGDGGRRQAATAPRAPAEQGVSGGPSLPLRVNSLLPNRGGRRPFAAAQGELAPAEQDEAAPVGYRALVTGGRFAAREGERWDELHEKGFRRIDYAYVLQPVKSRYELRVAVHWETDDQAEVALRALRATLAFYCLAKEQLGFDPTGKWGDPIDVWVTSKGQPGARAQGRSIYLYAVETERTPGEWLREVGHEYGHVCLPGIGGFKDTDDEWADGHISELLFPKWLTAGGVPGWMPWSVEEWEAAARPERERLMGLARGRPPTEALLKGTDEAAREYLLGMVLVVEDEGGPEALAKALAKCAQGTAEKFVQAAREVGVEVVKED